MCLSREPLIVVLGLAAASVVAGCAPTVVATAAAPTPPRMEGPQVQIQPLTADQLAAMLGVNVWTAKFSGGPIECWLEVEEEGQATLPKRIPEKDHLGAGTTSPPSEGTVELWWRKREDGNGGELNIHSSNGSYGYGLAKDAFTFTWPGFGAQSTTAGKGEPIEGEPGKEFVLVDYDARESLRPGDAKAPRRVHLKLMARFAEPK